MTIPDVTPATVPRFPTTPAHPLPLQPTTAPPISQNFFGDDRVPVTMNRWSFPGNAYQETVRFVLDYGQVNPVSGFTYQGTTQGSEQIAAWKHLYDEWNRYFYLYQDVVIAGGRASGGSYLFPKDITYTSPEYGEVYWNHIFTRVEDVTSTANYVEFTFDRIGDLFMWWVDWVQRIAMQDASAVAALGAGTANLVIGVYNTSVAGLIASYNQQAAALEQNPTYQDPGKVVAAQVAFVIAQITGAIAVVQAAITNIDNTVIKPTVAKGMEVAGGYVAQVQAIITTTMPVIAGAVAGAQAEIARQQAILEAEAKKQADNANAEITRRQAEAMAAIGSAVATLLGVVGTVTTLVGTLVGTAITEATRISGQVLAQAADRPLFYGALSAPVTITSPTDVVVIPAGGLTVTAD